jgi:oxidoreductase
MSSYKAIVIGSTGAIGRELVKLLAESAKCTKVIALSRRAIDTSSLTSVFPGLPAEQTAKVHVHVVDYEKLQSSDFDLHNADAAFCCLGTTRKGIIDFRKKLFLTSY